MRKSVIGPLLCWGLLCFPSAFAQTGGDVQPSGITFEQLFVSDSTAVGNTIQQIPDGGYILTGYSQNLESGDEDLLLIRTDSLGSEMWRKSYGGRGTDNGWEIRATSDGGFILTGYTASFGHGALDIWLLRLNSEGDTLWTRTFGGPEDDLSWSVCPLNNGGFLIAAQTESFGSGERDTWVLCTDSAGDTLWTDITGGAQVDRVFSADQLADGSVVVTGITNSEGRGDMDALVIRYSLTGKQLWRKTYGTSMRDIGHGISATRDGGMIVAGYTAGIGPGDTDFMLLRLNRDGDSLWSSVFGRVLDDRGMIARELDDGGYILVGFSRDTTSGRWDGYLTRTDDNGTVQWSRIIGGVHDETINSVIPTADGGFALIGRSWARGRPNCDVYMIKTDSLGVYVETSGH